ncbi:MAG: WD40 repeat domain-containing protein [Cyanobacteria bacterium P01_H01_bin.21]
MLASPSADIQVAQIRQQIEQLYEADLQLQALIESIRLGQLVRESSDLDEASRFQAITTVANVVYSIQQRHRIPNSAAWILDVDVSPDGQKIATAISDGTIRVRDFSGQLLWRTTGHEAYVWAIAFSPDGRLLATASFDGTVKLWSADDGQLIQTFQAHQERAYDVSFSPDGEQLVSAGEDGAVQLWSVDGRPLNVLSERRRATAVRFSPTGEFLVSGESLGDLQILSPTGELWGTLPGNDSSVLQLDISADGRKIVAGHRNGLVRLWHLQDLDALKESLDGALFFGDGVRFLQLPEARVGSPEDFFNRGPVAFVFDEDYLAATVPVVQSIELRGHSDRVDDVQFSPDGERIATSSRDGMVLYWSTSGDLLNTFRGHNGWVSGIAFSPEGDNIISGAEDGAVMIWQTSSAPVPQLLNDWPVSSGNEWYAAANHVAFSADSEWIAVAGKGGEVQIWDRQGQLLRSQPVSINAIKSLSFSPDKQWLALGDEYGQVALWRLDDSSDIVPSDNIQHGAAITSLSFSPDGQQLLTTSEDTTLSLWNLDDFSSVEMRHSEAVGQAVFSPDGQRLLSSSRDGDFYFWSLDGTRLRTLETEGGTIKQTAFSPAGNHWAIASGAQVQLGATDSQETQILTGFLRGLSNLTFGPQGQFLLGASTEGSVKVWDTSGQLLNEFSPFPEDGNITRRVYLSPDAETLAFQSEAGQIVLWDLRVDSLLRQGCDWLSDYLQSPVSKISDSERQVCENIS